MTKRAAQLIAGMLILLIGATGAWADSWKDWKKARDKYEDYVEKYHKERRKARKELRERDFDDYLEHTHKAQRNLEKANAYKRKAESIERHLRGKRGGRTRVPSLSRRNIPQNRYFRRGYWGRRGRTSYHQNTRSGRSIVFQFVW